MTAIYLLATLLGATMLCLLVVALVVITWNEFTDWLDERKKNRRKK